ncbi:MAG: transcriptional regulator [Methanospirillum sp.]|nr:transcriptional regulator [Methanospirillum sp.]
MIGELIALVIAIIVVVVLFKVLKSVPALVMNAAIGVAALWVLNRFFGLNVAIDLWSVLVSAIGGILGVILVVVLSFFGIAFVG